MVALIGTAIGQPNGRNTLFDERMLITGSPRRYVPAVHGGTPFFGDAATKFDHIWSCADFDLAAI